MTFIEAKQERDLLTAKMIEASNALQSFPKGDMGLTPEYVKNSPEFRQAKQLFDIANKELRIFNQRFCKEFKKELTAERKTKYAKQ